MLYLLTSSYSSECFHHRGRQTKCGKSSTSLEKKCRRFFHSLCKEYTSFISLLGNAVWMCSQAKNWPQMLFFSQVRCEETEPFHFLQHLYIKRRGKWDQTYCSYSFLSPFSLCLIWRNRAQPLTVHHLHLECIISI